MQNDDRILEAVVAAIACIATVVLVLAAAWRV